MAQGRDANEAMVLKILKGPEPITLEGVVSLLPELSWNQLFQTVDALSRRGEIALRRRRFDYELATR